MIPVGSLRISITKGSMMRIRRMAAALMAAASLAASVSLTTAGPAYADSPDPAWNEIYSPVNNLCVDDPGGARTAGTPLQLFHCHGYSSDGAPQRWHFDDTGRALAGHGEIYRIMNTGSGL